MLFYQKSSALLFWPSMDIENTRLNQPRGQFVKKHRSGANKRPQIHKKYPRLAPPIASIALQSTWREPSYKGRVKKNPPNYPNFVNRGGGGGGPLREKKNI